MSLLPSTEQAPTTFLYSDTALITRRPVCAAALYVLLRSKRPSRLGRIRSVTTTFGSFTLAMWAIHEIERRGLVDSGLSVTDRGLAALREFEEAGHSPPAREFLLESEPAVRESLQPLRVATSGEPLSNVGVVWRALVGESVRGATYRLSALDFIPQRARVALTNASIHTNLELAQLANHETAQLWASRIRCDYESVVSWASLADLMRIRGVGKRYSRLLQDAGIRSVAELGHEAPDELQARLRDANRQRVVRQLPSERSLVLWIKYAKGDHEETPVNIRVAGSATKLHLSMVTSVHRPRSDVGLASTEADA